MFFKYLRPLYAPEGEGAAEAEAQEALPLGNPGETQEGQNEVTEGQTDAAASGSVEEGNRTADGDDEAAQAAKAVEDANKAAAAKRRANAPKWAMDEITAQRAARRAAEEAIAAKDREIENLRLAAERAVSKDGKEAPLRTSDGQFASKEQFEAAVEARAVAREFAKATQDIFDAGVKDYQDFQESLNIMTAVGATSDEFAADLVAVDKANAHKIIHELAQTPELSKRLAAMSSRQRVAELTRMSDKMQVETLKSGAKQVSRAAAPLRALEGNSGMDDTDLYNDNLPDDVWSARFDKKYGTGPNGTQR